MIKITDLIIPLTYDLKILEDIVVKRLRIDYNHIESIKIINRSVDTLNKQDIHFKMSVAVYISGDEKEVVFQVKDKHISIENEVFYTVSKLTRKLKERPVIVGCGPAGMFAALVLAEAGADPILLERGQDIDNRRKSVSDFWNTGALDTNTNVQFGEGGAGAFSDGKLKTGFKDYRKIKVLNEFVEAGAPSEIMYLSKPHIGTDRLTEV
ncbi:MAG: hypothetical protein K0S55_1092, partial [Clostridia bacterium]|nr:hypothetical protein [Clostridia bacterium]